ncbi:uncharacterized protein N7515_001538 [Penicillium bovifimosum]|uniref:Uncharacterized protein n=1 Tax=Penicillium bovifimosum TaxID=126998 RepID=A0A9W9H9V6_9EURO|nr:uncharacterized protein N7515_001538 [Penicillium bovifimosum]KAJ5142751.1 hypothetical protein N7515_001538 [Penicillium bovifimosum]
MNLMSDRCYERKPHQMPTQVPNLGTTNTVRQTTPARFTRTKIQISTPDTLDKIPEYTISIEGFKCQT